MVGPLSVEDMCDSQAPPAHYRTVLATPLFMDYTSARGGRYFMLVEFTVSALSGVSIAVEMVAGCVAGSISVLIVLLAYAVAVFASRPHALPFDKYLTYIFAVGQVVAASLRVAYVVTKQPVRGQTAVDVFVLLLQLAALARGAFDFYNFVRKLRVFCAGDRQRRVERIVAEGGCDVDAMTAPTARVGVDDLMATGWGDADFNGDDGNASTAIALVGACRVADIGDDDDDADADAGPSPPASADDDAVADDEFQEVEQEEEDDVEDLPAAATAQRDAFLDSLLDGPSGMDDPERRRVTDEAAARASRRERRRAQRLLDALEQGLHPDTLSSTDDSDADSDDDDSNSDDGDSLDATVRVATFGMLMVPSSAGRRKKVQGRAKHANDDDVAGTGEAARRHILRAFGREAEVEVQRRAAQEAQQEALLRGDEDQDDDDSAAPNDNNSDAGDKTTDAPVPSPPAGAIAEADLPVAAEPTSLDGILDSAQSTEDGPTDVAATSPKTGGLTEAEINDIL